MSTLLPRLSNAHETRRTPGWRVRSLLVGLLLLSVGTPAVANSLDGAGRIVIVPYVISGLERETTVYLTNPGSLAIAVYGKYIGADGTPYAASVVGVRTCGVTKLNPGQSERIALSQLCPLGTPDVENFGYLELSTFGGFDSNPFFATSIVRTLAGNQFGVEGFPVGALDPGTFSRRRTNTLRVIGLEGDVPLVPGAKVYRMSHCYLGAMGEDKDVTVQLMEYGTGSAQPLGQPLSVKLSSWTMVKLANVLALAGAAPKAYSNVTAELYASAPTSGAGVVASCSVETLQTRTEDFRLATTPVPNDASRARFPVRADTSFRVGPTIVGYKMLPGTKARMAFYLRHEDRARCRIVPSVVAPPLEDPTPWQELLVRNPDGKFVAGGPNVSDTGSFFTGVKNEVAQGMNGRWTVEVSWRGTPATGYPPTGLSNNETFGVLCESTSGVSAMLPLDSATDDF